jgi:hypothetical protein
MAGLMDNHYHLVVGYTRADLRPVSNGSAEYTRSASISATGAPVTSSERALMPV